jgi:anti-sigma regulatory factor (Ser/Thr protein kinase)
MSSRAGRRSGMQFAGEASGTVQGFVHQALIYESDREFTDVALPFVEEAAVSGEPTLVAVRESNVESLRAALGRIPPGVTLFSVEQWYETSARTREKLRSWVAEHADGARVRVIGEPPWAIGHDAQVRDWARHDSVLNLAFAGSPASVICAYDARELTPEIIEHAESTHPLIVGPEGASYSEAYENPLEFCRRLDSSVADHAGEPCAELSFGLADLAAVRRTIGSLALEAGLPRSRADDLVLAVNEIATNAVVHGRSPATVRAWRTDGELVFEVTDCGSGINDALAGQLAPARGDLGGRGLWLTRLLCDAVEIRNGVGCTVSMHATAPSYSLAH